MMSEINVLIVEDDPDGGLSVKEAVEDAGYVAKLVDKGRAGVQAFQKGDYDVVLSDLALPDIDGIEVLRQIKAQSATVPVIIMTAYGSIDSSVQAVKVGAYDYLTKPLDLDELQAKVGHAVETQGLRRQVQSLKQHVRETFAADSMIAKSAKMKILVEQIHTLADTHATVLITGESGTGKELVARALHVESSRAEKPFVAINCGAFSEALLESELFGHEKGSFTGASSQHKGAFERAGGGTLFLDEIGDAPAAVQVKLLRVLEQREITRVGGSRAFKVDVRLISATNRDLEERVEEGAFREDLLYRLQVVNLHIPPLRERKEEIRPMAEYFMAKACEEHGRTINQISPAYFEKLERYDWPGNVRQLRNAVEASVVMAARAQLNENSLQISDGDSGKARDAEFVVPADMTMEELEREILMQALQRYNGNRSITAEKMGISRRTIQRKIQDYDLPF